MINEVKITSMPRRILPVSWVIEEGKSYREEATSQLSSLIVRKQRKAL